MIATTSVSNTSSYSVDYKALKQRLKEDNDFLIQLFKVLPNLKSEDDLGDDCSPYLLNHGRDNQKPPLGKDGSIRAKSLEELHARLKELRGKKVDYKDKLLRKRLKNQMKKKKRSKELSMKRTLIKLPKSEKEGIVGLANGVTSHKPSKPVFNSAGKMVFSKFDFRSEEVIEESVEKRKKKEEPKKLLQRLKRERDEDGDEDEGEKKASKSWATILARSRGEKVLDDPELLKKSINRSDAKKRSSQKKWKEREDKVKKEKEERQAKRSAAISAKKQEKKTKKLKKAVKKGRIIPGFS